MAFAVSSPLLSILSTSFVIEFQQQKKLKRQIKMEKKLQKPILQNKSFYIF